MTQRLFRGDAPAVAQVTRLAAPTISGEIALTISGSNKTLTFPSWTAAAIAAAWNACTYPEFREAAAAASGTDVLLTAREPGRPFYVSATVNGEDFANEMQYLYPVNVTGGTTVATWAGESTAPFNPTTETGAALQTRLEAFIQIAPGDVIVTGAAGGPWTVAWSGQYAGQNVPLISLSTASLTGGVAAQNERQRLSLASSGVAVAFALQRPDTNAITADLTTPVTATALDAALTAIGYDVTCTGGPVTHGGLVPFAGTLTDDGYFATDESSYYHTQLAAILGAVNTGASGMKYHDVVVRFALPVAQGATITNAVLTVYSTGLTGCTLRAYASDNAAWPTTAAAANGVALGSASVAFTIDGYSSVDVSPIIQELVARAGWVSGNHLVIRFLNNGSLAYAPINCQEAGDGAATLTVTTNAETTNIPIDITWIGGNAATDIPQLVVIGSSYGPTPIITTLQHGRAATAPTFEITTIVAGGDQVRVRDSVRSQGPNHWDDPRNWITEEGDLGVPGRLDLVYLESSRIDLMWGLGQRLGFVAQPATNRLRLVTGRAIFWEGQQVEVRTSNTLPAGLAINTTYFVTAVDGPYLQLALTAGGAALDITSVGTGSHLIGCAYTKLEIESRYSGKQGLPRRNSAGDYWEYRERSLACWCPSIRIGQGTGGGSNRIMLDTGHGGLVLQLVQSSGSVESGVPAVQWRGTRPAGQTIRIEILGGNFGTAIFPEETSVIDELVQRSGAVLLGREVTIYNIDKTGGSLVSLGATIEGVAVLT